MFLEKAWAKINGNYLKSTGYFKEMSDGSPEDLSIKDFINKNFLTTEKMEFNEYGRYKSWLIPPNYYRGLSIKQEVQEIRDIINKVGSIELHKKRTPLLYNEVFSLNFEELNFPFFK